MCTDYMHILFICGWVQNPKLDFTRKIQERFVIKSTVERQMGGGRASADGCANSEKEESFSAESRNGGR